MNTLEYMNVKFDQIDTYLGNALWALESLQQEKGTDQRRLALAKTNLEQAQLWFKSATEKYNKFAEPEETK